MSSIASKKHFLLLPYPAYGHMTPVLELGKKIAAYHDVTVAIQAEKIQQLRKRGFVTTEDHIELFPIDDGFVEEHYADDAVKKATAAYEAVTQSIVALAATLHLTKPGHSEVNDTGLRPVDVVIVDNFILAATVTPTLVEKGIPFYHFNTGGASVAAMFLLVDKDFPTYPSENQIPPLFKPLNPNQPLDPMPSTIKPFFQQVNDCVHLSRGIIANTVREIDEDVIDNIISIHPKMKGLRFLTVGPLNAAESSALATQEQVGDWLESKAESSVVYVSFGSVSELQEAQIRELVQALLKLGKPLIWSLPKRQHEFLPGDVKVKINQQFESTDSEFLILEWSPQKVILNHRSTGVFLSHCGWNSMMETLAGGVPVVAWPMFGDQFMNAAWLVDHGMGVLVERTGWMTGDVITSEKIVECIEEAGEWGDEARNRHETSLEWTKKMRVAWTLNGSSTQSLLELVNFE